MARVGLLKNFEAALVSSFKQSRNIHTVCSSCCRTRLPVSVSVVPHRYMRKLYPPIMDPTMIGDIQPEENTGIQLDYTPVLGNKGPELMEKIENVCVSNGLGRLFAVVHINMEQRKITTEDILVINGFFPPQIGDRIRLEKDFRGQESILQNPTAMNNANNGHIRGKIRSMLSTSGSDLHQTRNRTSISCPCW